MSVTRTTVVGTLAFLALSGCADGANVGGAADGKLQVVASFYPLQYLADRVGGDLLTVTNLTPSGGEPHDLELTPKDLADISDADLVVYEHGVAPAVDAAVTSEAPNKSWDVSAAADLTLHYTPIEDGQAQTNAAGAVDPHFWLDPVRFKAVGEALADRLADLDPDHAQAYRANADALDSQLDVLDEEWKTQTKTCANRDLVTSHNAFGYLSQRYGFEQYGITGLTPEDEPSARDLAAASDFVRQHGISTIYYETLVGPDIAETVAQETGAQTAVLDPIEGLSDASAGADYGAIMRANLAAVVAGQDCR